MDELHELRRKDDIAAMWRFVCSRGLKVEFRDIHTEGSEVKGHWECDYKFQGKRDVHNEIDSTFTFRDGKILSHEDKASRWHWAKQALVFPKDVAVTIIPPLLRHQAKKVLQEFRAREGRSG